jgi:phytoene dehydrogenase-like protein
MPQKDSYDAVVIGSGPNGLASAITLAQKGLSVLLLEAKPTIGGGMRSAELTLPGYVHDICSAIHPLGIGSPFFQTLPLSNYGLEWIHPSAPLAHPLDDGTAVLLERSLETTSQGLQADASSYQKLMGPLVQDWDRLAPNLLGPLRLPSHPIALARFGLNAIRSAEGLSNRWFQTMQARALFAGLAAHAIMPLNQPLTAAFGMILGALGHKFGWPMARGGSQNIAHALAAYFRSLGGEIVTNKPISSLDQLPFSRTLFFDVSPKQLLNIVGDRFPTRYKEELENYRYGPGVFKIDWALNHPIPWKAPECARAGTVHVGGTFEEIALSESEVWQGKHPEKSYVLVAQQSLFDPSRAPPGKQTAWAYCHVPNGSTFDMTQRIEAQIERFAPGFGDCILARSTKNAQEFEIYNPNYIGGDINGGVEDLSQLFTRPARRIVPYSTPVKGIYICSASTPPGGGVHGMCGYHAARSALKHCF